MRYLNSCIPLLLIVKKHLNFYLCKNIAQWHRIFAHVKKRTNVWKTANFSGFSLLIWIKMPPYWSTFLSKERLALRMSWQKRGWCSGVRVLSFLRECILVNTILNLLLICRRWCSIACICVIIMASLGKPILGRFCKRKKILRYLI